MKFIKILVLSIVLFALNGEKISQEILDKIPFSNRKNFSSEMNLGIKVDNAVFLNKQDYEQIFEDVKLESDSCYLFGKFKIDKNRIGVLCLRTTNECDHRIEILELLVFDNYKIIDFKTIMFKDNHGQYYEVLSHFSKDFSLLNLHEKSVSEYSIESGVMDTMFTKSYKIDLKSKNLDTISTNSSFTLLRNPPL